MGLIGGTIILRLWDFNLYSLLQSGNIFFILASLSWVSVTIITSQSKNIIPFIPYTFWSFVFASCLCLPLSLQESLLSVFYFDWIFWLNLLILAVVAMSFGTSIYFLASVQLGPKRASAFIFIVPLTAMGFAIYFLSEPFQLTTAIGGTLGIAAVYIINH